MRSPSRPDRAGAPLFSSAPLPVAVLSDRERVACLRLIRSENVGPVTFREMINQFGGAEAALAALSDMSRRGSHGRRIKVCPSDAAEAELEAAQAAGATPVFTIEPGYPSLLAEAGVPPPMIYVRGIPELLTRPVLAIVGSRDCSAAGMRVAATLAAELSAAGFVIASGLARGIDAVAHRGGLAKGTAAVLAGGIDVLYPPEHRKLYDEIGERGCLLTEMPPGFSPRAQDFPRRNRIISGISLGVVIVEAAKRSGTLVTARYAGEQGRDVFAVPGHPLDPRAEGTNRLIQDGAKMVLTTDDIISELRPQLLRYTGSLATGAGEPERGGFQANTGTATWEPAAAVASGVEAGGDRSGGSEQATIRVLAALGPHPVDIDALVPATGFSIRAVQIALIELDLAGRIERHGAQLVSLKPGGDDAT